LFKTQSLSFGVAKVKTYFDLTSFFKNYFFIFFNLKY
jgi:hypothetical protein